eukprot:TRINITY_DN14217_c0_g1_i5.p4 TRINITY_DN14217_c0_g1~~TRINITY_DN14217_c0_g1_i5.p4  ORF type:complete len:133 (+),score=13.92 TRINITY_DN14217_c0_g1_i5:154-552(+)
MQWSRYNNFDSQTCTCGRYVKLFDVYIDGKAKQIENSLNTTSAVSEANQSWLESFKVFNSKNKGNSTQKGRNDNGNNDDDDDDDDVGRSSFIIDLTCLLEAVTVDTAYQHILCEQFLFQELHLEYDGLKMEN